jgi:hypothetical protein
MSPFATRRNKRSRGGSHELDRLIVEMKRASGVETDRDLALYLGIDRTAVAAWRRRGRLPDKYKVRFTRAVGESALPNAGWWELRRAYLFALVRLVAMRLNDSVSFDAPGAFSDVWYGGRLSAFHDYAERLLSLPKGATKADLRKAYDRLKADLDRSDFAEWIAMLR